MDMARKPRPSRLPDGISTCAATMVRGCRPARPRSREVRRFTRNNARTVMELSAKAKGDFRRLVGGAGTLRDDRPEPTVGSYWPFAPTLWDYVNRAMPMAAPHTLSAD